MMTDKKKSMKANLSTKIDMTSSYLVPPSKAHSSNYVQQKQQGRKTTMKNSNMDLWKIVRRSAIHTQRQTSSNEPELMAAHRRTVLFISKKKGFHEKVEFLRSPQPLHLGQDDHHKEITNARVTMYRELPGLHFCSNENAYLEACKKHIWKLVTIEVDKGKWLCLNNIGQIIEGEIVQHELCHTINIVKNERCYSCRARRPVLRPFYAYLKRLSMAMKEQRKELLKLIAKYDSEIFRCDSAISENNREQYSCQKQPNKVDEQGKLIVNNSGREDEDDCDIQMRTTDINLIQGGVWQRLDKKSSIPLLIAHRFQLEQRLKQTRGELCIIVQVLYEMGVIHLQRVLRGHFIRKRRAEFERIYWEGKRYKAALKIQCLVRTVLSKNLLKQKRMKLHEKMAIRIQTNVRAMLARMRFRCLWEAHHNMICNMMAEVIQRSFRLWRTRRILRDLAEQRRKEREAMEREKLRILRNKASLAIQRIARGYIAKRRVVERRIELQLSDRLMKITDDFLSNGDMWMFLKRIDQDYRSYQKTIEHIVVREDKMASTFVSKVVQVRQREYDAAWKNYMCEEFEREGIGPESRFILEKMLQGAKLPSMDSYVKKHSVGPMEESFNKSAISQTSYKDHDLKHLSMYLPYSQNVCNRKLEKANMSHHYKYDIDFDNERDEKVRESAASYQIETQKTPFLACKSLGVYLRRDIPRGLNDSIERFIGAVSMRCFDKEITKSDHQNLSPQFLQVRKEFDAWAKAKPIIDELHDLGIRIIRQLLPIENMEQSLRMSKTLEESTIILKFIEMSKKILCSLMMAEKMNYVAFKKKYQSVQDKIAFQQKTTNRPSEEEIIEKGLFIDPQKQNSCDFLDLMAEDIDSMPNGLWDKNKELSSLIEVIKEVNDGERVSVVNVSQSERNKIDEPMIDKNTETKTDIMASSLYTESGIKARDQFRLDLQNIMNRKKLPDDGDKIFFKDQHQEWNGGLFYNAHHLQNKNDQVNKGAMKKKKKKVPSTTDRKRSSTWVIPYTNRILSNAKESFPAYRQIRYGPLLFDQSSTRPCARKLIQS